MFPSPEESQARREQLIETIEKHIEARRQRKADIASGKINPEEHKAQLDKLHEEKDCPVRNNRNEKFGAMSSSGEHRDYPVYTTFSEIVNPPFGEVWIYTNPLNVNGITTYKYAEELRNAIHTQFSHRVIVHIEFGDIQLADILEKSVVLSATHHGFLVVKCPNALRCNGKYISYTGTIPSTLTSECRTPRSLIRKDFPGRKFIEAGRLAKGSESILVLVPHGTREQNNSCAIQFYRLRDVIDQAISQEDSDFTDVKGPTFTLMDPTLEEEYKADGLIAKEKEKADIVLKLTGTNKWQVLKSPHVDIENADQWILKFPEVSLNELFANNPKDVWVYVDHRLMESNQCENLFGAFANHMVERRQTDIKLHLMSGHPTPEFLVDKEIVLMASTAGFFVDRALQIEHVQKVIPIEELIGHELDEPTEPTLGMLFSNPKISKVTLFTVTRPSDTIEDTAKIEVNLAELVTSIRAINPYTEIAVVPAASPWDKTDTWENSTTTAHTLTSWVTLYVYPDAVVVGKARGHFPSLQGKKVLGLDN